MRDADTPAPMQAARSTTSPSRPKDEIARLGKEFYERNIRRQVEADHVGEVVAIDVDSGDYALGKNCSLVASDLPDARTQYPVAPPVVG